MKKIFGVFLIICLLILYLPHEASAVSGCWYRVEQDNVAFFKQPIDSENQKLFLLEKTYYFYAISSSNGFLQTELFDNLNGFVKICGYVKTSEVVKCDSTPVLPYYPTETLTVKQSNAILKAQPDINGEDIAVALNGQNVCFYGRSCQNQDWYYVKYQNDFGYVQSRQLTTLLVATHPTPLVIPEPPVEEEQIVEEETPEQTSQTFPAEVILILLICIPAIIIVFLLFMPQKKVKQAYVPKPKYMADSDTFDDLDLL